MKNKKLLIFSPNFSYKNTHGQTFIQTRINQYSKNGYKIDLISLFHKQTIKKNKNCRIYYFKSYSEIKNFLFKNINKYNKVFIHFITFQILKILYNFKNLNLCIWIHGIEGQKWTWYKFDLFLKPYWFLRHVIYNTIHLYYLKNYIKKNIKNIKFIFVSKWMKKVFCRDLNLNISKNNFKVIPNPVDNSYFRKFNRSKKIRNNILIIKNYGSYKYAGDITIDYLIKFSKMKLFNNFKFTLIGKGPILEKRKKFIKKLNNVKIIDNFISNEKLHRYHKENSIFIYLTRMDSQSVTLSEALSSGLVSISSNNTAIPEFINNNHNGFLINNFEDFINCIKLLNKNTKLLKKISNNSIKKSKFLQPESIYNEERKFLKL